MPDNNNVTIREHSDDLVKLRKEAKQDRHDFIEVVDKKLNKYFQDEEKRFDRYFDRMEDQFKELKKELEEKYVTKETHDALSDQVKELKEENKTLKGHLMKIVFIIIGGFFVAVFNLINWK